MHKILINAAIIFVIAAASFGAFSWWRLYIVQDTSDFYYTATRIIPIPVADVNGELVRYGDYMRRVRASIYYLEKQDNRDLGTEDGRRELEYTRRHNMDEAAKAALAYKIAAERSLSMSEEEIDENIQATLGSGSGGPISAKAYENSIKRYFGWSMDDYRHIVRDRLMVRKVSFTIDSAAYAKVYEAKKRLNVGDDFSTVVKQFSDDEATRNKNGNAGAVSIDSVDRDGLIVVAQQLREGQISDVIEGIDAFYIIKLTAKTATTVKYSLIRVSLSELDNQFEQLKQEDKIVEYIKIDAK
jgi:parvulin-like peptidyl-prolyl isomerase